MEAIADGIPKQLQPLYDHFNLNLNNVFLVPRPVEQMSYDFPHKQDILFFINNNKILKPTHVVRMNDDTKKMLELLKSSQENNMIMTIDTIFKTILKYTYRHNI